MSTVQVVNYSDKAEARLQEIANENGGAFNWELAKKTGIELGKKPKSIVAKLLRMGIVYNKQPGYVAKTGKKPTAKKDIVSQIETVMQSDTDSLKDIVSAPKLALEKLLGGLIAFGDECYKSGIAEADDFITDDGTEEEVIEESNDGTEEETV